MRTKYILALIGAALVATSASAAPNFTEKNNISSIAVLGKVGAKQNPASYSRVPGMYQLDDGRVLEVTLEDRKLFAHLGNAKVEILQSGPNSFASRDDALRVAFDSVGYPVDVTVDELKAVAKN